LRPGRFDELIYVPVPDEEGRRRILGIHTADMPLGPDVNLDALARETERYTGADLEDLVRRAGLEALREDLETQEVPMPLFRRALEATRASVTPEMEAEYQQILDTLKRESPLGTRRIGFEVARAVAETSAEDGGGAAEPSREAGDGGGEKVPLEAGGA
ncbi:MAG TPA: hypothetical protein VMT87_09755, partial [Vicinamibacteria bacterium]|nr:hypothetical protein [Vicinamibacteria bacterium]